MAARGLAFAAPTTESMTEVAMGVAGAGIAGVVEGIVTIMAPKTGALAPFLSWGTLIGVPMVGAAMALFSGEGMLNDLGKGIAAGGTAIIAYTLPAMLVPASERRPNPALNSGSDVKLLGRGGALQTAQNMGARAMVGLEF